MRKATTLGFSVDEAYRARLDHLADVFGGGNRSAFLRAAIEIMERLETANRLAQLQSYGEERIGAAGFTAGDIPAIVDRALADPHPDAVAQAKLVVASLRGRHRLVPRGEDRHPAGDLYAELLSRQ